MARQRTHRDPKQPWRKQPWRQTRRVRSFDDDESDETLIGLGFIDTKPIPAPAAADQPAAGD